MGTGSSVAGGQGRDSGDGRALPERFGVRLMAALDAEDARTFEAVLAEVTPQQRLTLANNMVHKGRSLLQHAAWLGSRDICAQLLQQGCTADRLNASPAGGSALHEAVAALLAGPSCPRHAAQLADTISLLLDHGADPCLENAAGLTPMDMLQGRKPEQGAAAAAGAAAGGGGGGGSGGIAALSGVLSGASGAGPGRGLGFGLERLMGALRGQSGGRRHVSLLRSMEARAALFCGAARIQVAPYTARDWSPVWLAVLPRRCSRPLGAAPRACPEAPELLAFAAGGSRRPLLRVLLGGCAVQRADGAARLLVLPCGKKRLKTDFMRPCCVGHVGDAGPGGAAGGVGGAAAAASAAGGGGAGREAGGAEGGDIYVGPNAPHVTHWALHLRPSDGSEQQHALFARLLDVCRSCAAGAPPPGPGAAGGVRSVSPGPAALAPRLHVPLPHQPQPHGSPSAPHGQRRVHSAGVGPAPGRAGLTHGSPRSPRRHGEGLASHARGVRSAHGHGAGGQSPHVGRAGGHEGSGLSAGSSPVRRLVLPPLAATAAPGHVLPLGRSTSSVQGQGASRGPGEAGAQAAAHGGAAGGEGGAAGGAVDPDGLRRLASSPAAHHAAATRGSVSASGAAGRDEGAPAACALGVAAAEFLWPAGNSEEVQGGGGSGTQLEQQGGVLLGLGIDPGIEGALDGGTTHSSSACDDGGDATGSGSETEGEGEAPGGAAQGGVGGAAAAVEASAGGSRRGSGSGSGCGPQGGEGGPVGAAAPRTAQEQLLEQLLEQQRQQPACSRCVLCLEAAPVVGFRHGHTVHCCCCYECANELLGRGAEEAAGEQQQHPQQQRAPGGSPRARAGAAPGPAGPTRGAGGAAGSGGPGAGGGARGAAPAEGAHGGRRREGDAPVLCPLCRQEVQEVLLVYTA